VVKVQRASDYTAGHLALAKATCLELAVRLGDVLDDGVVVGGLVPALLVPHTRAGLLDAHHAGTMDVDH